MEYWSIGVTLTSLNVQRRTPNTEHRTPNTEHRTPNTEHRTPNYDWPEIERHPHSARDHPDGEGRRAGEHPGHGARHRRQAVGEQPRRGPGPGAGRQSGAGVPEGRGADAGDVGAGPGGVSLAGWDRAPAAH